MEVAQTPQERIRQRRMQMLIHSYLYYQVGDSIVSDHDWQRWADELAALQRAHPGAIGFYDDAFVDWDGSTGFHLPQDEWVSERAIKVRIINSNLYALQRGTARMPAPSRPPPPAKRAPAPAHAQASLF